MIILNNQEWLLNEILYNIEDFNIHNENSNVAYSVEYWENIINYLRERMTEIKTLVNVYETLYKTGICLKLNNGIMEVEYSWDTKEKQS